MTEEAADLSSARRAGKSESAFRTISEVADDLDVPQHVLRFWEGKFPQVKPLKRGGGRRYYRPDDVALLRRIRDLLYSEGYTIKGVQKLLKEGGAPAPQAPRPREADPEQSLLDLGQPETGRALVEAPELLPDDDDMDDGDHGADEPVEGGISASVRNELQDLLRELEQLRNLLQPR